MAINVVVEDIIRLFDINMYVETGINAGMSLRTVFDWSKKLPGHFRLLAVDNNESLCLRVMGEYKDTPNVQINCDESVNFLDELIQSEIITSGTDRVLFFLDAHSDTESPLRDELALILQLGNKPIVVIDDFKYPGRPWHECGYSTFSMSDSLGNWIGQPCGTEVVRALLIGRADAIYHCTIPNHQGRGSGIIFVDWDLVDIQTKLERLPLYRESLWGR